jgi:cysteine-rich repeat protein
MRAGHGLVVVLVLAVVGAARVAGATTANDLCAPTVDPCTVTGTISVANGSILDFGTRALVVQKTLDVGGGAMTIRAGSVRVAPGGSLLGKSTGKGGTITIVAVTTIAVEASGSTLARVDTSGDGGGGRIDFTAGGAVTLAGSLTSRGSTNAGPGGTISIVAGSSLTVTGPITASGGSQEVGGDVGFSATNALTIGGVVDASGGSVGGGTITCDAGGDLTTTARLDVSAMSSGGDGGSIDLTAGGTLALRGPIAGGSMCSSTNGCATAGADVSLGANGAVRIEAQVVLSGASPDGTGGTLSVDAGTDVVQTGAILADGRGNSGCGDDVDGVSFTANGNVTLGPIDISGGFCGGGAIAVDAGGTLIAAGELSADSRTTGPGGTIDFGAATVSIPGKVHASGPSLTGGRITIAACDIDVASTGQVQTKGTNGVNDFSGSGRITIEGQLASGGSGGVGGANTLRYRDSTMPPAIAGGASVVPAATRILTPALPPCGGVLPPACGNRQLDPGEECDDGNTTACDGCSATCQIEGCGNGVPECAEQCDDGNATACDGCSPTCQREGCGNNVVECGEECDAGSANGTPGANCDATCHIPPPPNCGNGQMDPGEGCDDGNTTSCDGCSSLCQPEGCGNGVVECGEQCDDANTSPCDGCSATCQVEACGNGVPECDEECDDGSANGTVGDVCDVTCHHGTVCGLADPGAVCIPCAKDVDCDRAGRCAGLACQSGTCITVQPPLCSDDNPGTLDQCILDDAGTPQCVHTCLDDAGCRDGNPCDTATCVGGACVPGPPATCDDGDPCTDDACDAGQGCIHTARIGLAGVSCRVDQMLVAVNAATVAELATPFRRPLLGRLGRLRASVDGVLAAEASGDVRRERRLLRRSSTQLIAVGSTVGQARRRGRISAQLADLLVTAITGAYHTVGDLRTTLTP